MRRWGKTQDSLNVYWMRFEPSVTPGVLGMFFWQYHQWQTMEHEKTEAK